jgi:hypothetical protein
MNDKSRSSDTAIKGGQSAKELYEGRGVLYEIASAMDPVTEYYWKRAVFLFDPTPEQEARRKSQEALSRFLMPLAVLVTLIVPLGPLVWLAWLFAGRRKKALLKKLWRANLNKQNIYRDRLSYKGELSRLEGFVKAELDDNKHVLLYSISRTQGCFCATALVNGGVEAAGLTKFQVVTHSKDNEVTVSLSAFRRYIAVHEGPEPDSRTKLIFKRLIETMRSELAAEGGDSTLALCEDILSKHEAIRKKEANKLHTLSVNIETNQRINFILVCGAVVMLIIAIVYTAHSINAFLAKPAG